MKKFCFLIILLLCHTTFVAQENKERAEEYAENAILYLEEDHPKKAFKSLKKAVKLDPENIVYHYRLAYAYFAAEKYKRSVEKLREIIDKDEEKPMVYELLGNNYIMLDAYKKAENAYLSGVQKFPKEGVLYEELGSLAMMNKEYETALEYFEDGLLMDPEYAGNYYWSSKIYCSSTEEVWGLIYGEIFMNLERNSIRTQEISALLYSTLRREVQFDSDSLITVSICKNANYELSKKDSIVPYSFGKDVVEMNFMKSLVNIETISLESIDHIRKNFIHHYYLNDNNVFPRHSLFEFHKRLRELGHFEAYNYWVFMMGDPDSFAQWENNNRSQWLRFLDWYKNNQLEITENTVFHRKHF